MATSLAGNDWFDRAQSQSKPQHEMCPAFIKNVDL